MRLATIASSATAFTIVLLAGCSDSSAPPAKHATEVDSSVYVPPALPPQPGTITVTVKGHGTVDADDTSFSCTSDGVTDATCVAPHRGVTFYAGAAIGWGFDHWEPSMSPDLSLDVQSWTYSPETAIFTKLPLPGADD